MVVPFRSRELSRTDKRPGFTVRFNEPPACWCSFCGGESRYIARSLADAAFQPAPGQCNPLRLPFQSTRAEISERPFTRPQQRFRHHCEVNVPDLRLPSHTAKFREAVRSPAPSRHSVSRPKWAISSRVTRFSRPFAPPLQATAASTPLWVLRPSGSKRSTA